METVIEIPEPINQKWEMHLLHNILVASSADKREGEHEHIGSAVA